MMLTPLGVVLLTQLMIAQADNLGKVTMKVAVRSGDVAVEHDAH